MTSPFRSPHRCSLLLLAWVSFPTGAVAQNAADAELLAAFSHHSASEQERLVTALRAQLQPAANPWLEAVAQCIAEGAAPGTARGRSLSRRTPKQRPPAAARAVDPWLPTAHRYSFGTGVIESEPSPRDRAAAAAAERTAGVQTALAGMLPDSDLAIASLMQKLDRDQGADAFAAFLVAWRNGDESFYEALDRTAGTEDSVFYYDAMLGDFVASFANGKDAECVRVRSGLQASHDALHRAFLSYRQYRGFREAVALAMVLQVDQRFPSRLRRYEAKVDGAYSLREQVIMVLAGEGFDARRVATSIAAAAPPLPQPLWSADYDPFPAWNGTFVAAQEKMIAEAGSTDRWLAKACDQLREWSAATRSTAQALLAAVPSKAHRP